MFADYSIVDTSKLILLKGGSRTETQPQANTGKINCQWNDVGGGSRKDVTWDDNHISCDMTDAQTERHELS